MADQKIEGRRGAPRQLHCTRCGAPLGQSRLVIDSPLVCPDCVYTAEVNPDPPRTSRRRYALPLL